jgi:tetratricopeptide (TPR) repeat protein
MDQLRNLLQAILDDPQGPTPLDARDVLQDPETLAQLRTLGYVASRSAPEDRVGMERPDPKQMVEVLRRIFEIQTQINAGQYSLAVEEIASILANEDPENLRCLSLLSEIAPNEKVRQRAAEILAPQIRKNLPAPLDFTVPARLGLALAGMKRYREAADAFRQALAVAPNSAEIHFNLGGALQLLDESAEQYLPHLEQALELATGGLR